VWIQKGDDKGRWTEYVNTETGESSIKEHKLKVVWRSCKPDKHYFELTGNREATCSKCGFVRNFVLGLEKLEDGKIVRLG
jgi:hypothetical protein